MPFCSTCTCPTSPVWDRLPGNPPGSTHAFRSIFVTLAKTGGYGDRSNENRGRYDLPVQGRSICSSFGGWSARHWKCLGRMREPAVVTRDRARSGRGRLPSSAPAPPCARSYKSDRPASARSECAGPHHRRKGGYRQGVGARAPSTSTAPGPRRRFLALNWRGHPGATPGERTVRPRERLLHRR